jgi:hypothetical protein
MVAVNATVAPVPAADDSARNPAAWPVAPARFCWVWLVEENAVPEVKQARPSPPVETLGEVMAAAVVLPVPDGAKVVLVGALLSVPLSANALRTRFWGAELAVSTTL